MWEGGREEGRERGAAVGVADAGTGLWKVPGVIRDGST